MRVFSILLFAALVGVASVYASPPNIPPANEVARFERVYPVFQSNVITIERGDALLALLDGGQAVDRWMKNGLPSGVVEVLPVPMRLWVMLALTNGATYRIGLSHDGGLLELPDGLYEFSKTNSQQAAAKWMAEMEADLRREVMNAQKPCTYQIGTIDDGGTLSGVAHLFYGDATKWQQIYDANRSAIKNPNVVSGNRKLTIPILK
jgi:hypothetical protein